MEKNPKVYVEVTAVFDPEEICAPNSSVGRTEQSMKLTGCCTSAGQPASKRAARASGIPYAFRTEKHTCF